MAACSSAYCNIAVCGPSRSSLMTGRRPDATHINAAAGNSWCWCQRGEFMTLPTYFRTHGYTTAGGGKLFHPDACSKFGKIQWIVYTCRRLIDLSLLLIAGCGTHPEGDDSRAWSVHHFEYKIHHFNTKFIEFNANRYRNRSLPYFPPTDTNVGFEADCVGVHFYSKMMILQSKIMILPLKIVIVVT